MTRQPEDATIRAVKPMQIAILGWGSLLWEDQTDRAREFDEHRNDNWCYDGPSLKLEFSRVSSSRNHALTLVLDYRNGEACHVAYTLSKRKCPDDAICDLRCREGTLLANIGCYFADDSQDPRFNDEEALTSIRNWATEKSIDIVVWTDLENNFKKKSKCKKCFSIEAARAHIQALDPKGKAKAAEYVWRAPNFIKTPLRRALQAEPWFERLR